MTTDFKPRLAWLPIPLLLAAILVLWAADLRAVHESQTVLTVCNFFFSTAAAALVAVLVGRSYLLRGSPGLLLFGCGVLIWGAAGTVAPLLFPYGTNALIGGHNALVWFSALCHLAGALLCLTSSRKPRLVGLKLALAYAGALVSVWLVVILATEGRLPVFFVQGQGGTPLRTFVLGSTIAMFVFAAAVLWRANRPSPSAFVRWYGAALLLVATGTLGIALQTVHGGVLGWTGRGAQFLGGAYMLVAAIASLREAPGRGIWLTAALRASEDRYRSLVELSPEAIIVHQDGRFVFANPAALRLYGASSPAELLGRSVLDMIHPDDREQVRSRMASAVGGARTPLREVRALRLDGHVMDVESMGAPIDFGGRPAVQVVIRDVTERKRTEARLAQQAFMLSNVSDAVIGFDMNYRITFWGQSAERMFGYTAAEVVGKAGMEVLRPTYVSMTREEARERLARDGYLEAEFIECTKDGRALSVDTRTQVFRNDRGEPTGMVAVNRDITDRKQAEEALRRSEGRWNAAIETLAAGAIIATEDEQVIYWNPAAREMHGIGGPDEFLEPLERTPFTFELWTPDGSRKLSLDEWPMRRLKRGETLRNLELRIRRPDQGWEKVFSYGGTMVDTAGGERMIFLSCYDLTGLRRAEQELRAANEELTQFNEAMVGRELRMVELKREINALCEAAGGAPRYDLGFAD